MTTKCCNTCKLILPDTPEYFSQKLKKGGVWGSIARCKLCEAERRKELRLIRKIESEMRKQGLDKPSPSGAYSQPPA